MRSCNARLIWFYRIYPIVAVWIAALFALSVSGAFHETSPVGISRSVEDSSYRILILGTDEASGLSDVIILATVDTQTGEACLAQIPRDTYFRYTDRDYKKINGAAELLGGEKALCKMLGNALAVDIDSYIAVDLDSVCSAVDILGGVTLNVPCDMDYDDPAQGLSIHLKAGRQRLTGEQAAQFIRFRSGYLRADIDRMDAQKLFLAALFEAAKKLNAGDIPRIVLLAARSVRTDMSVSQMVSLLRTARLVESENVTLLTLPGEEVQSKVSGAWYYILSREGTASVLESHFGISEAVAVLDPAHLFSDAEREDFECVYRREILPKYYTVSELGEDGNGTS